jgi:hypothetical protein
MPALNQAEKQSKLPVLPTGLDLIAVGIGDAVDGREGGGAEVAQEHRPVGRLGGIDRADRARADLSALAPPEQRPGRIGAEPTEADPDAHRGVVDHARVVRRRDEDGGVDADLGLHAPDPRVAAEAELAALEQAVLGPTGQTVDDHLERGAVADVALDDALHAPHRVARAAQRLELGPRPLGGGEHEIEPRGTGQVGDDVTGIGRKDDPTDLAGEVLVEPQRAGELLRSLRVGADGREELGQGAAELEDGGAEVVDELVRGHGGGSWTGVAVRAGEACR